MSARDHVIVSSVDWGFLWQGPQEIATRLARRGNRVLFIENMGVRRPEMRDAKRAAARLRRWASGLLPQGLRVVSEHLHVCSPLVFPPFGGAIQSSLNRTVFLPAISRITRRLGMSNPVIWSFLPTDAANALVGNLRGPDSRIVYYCAADWAALAADHRRITESERRLLQSCDVTFAICRELAERCARWCPHTHVIPYGVDLERFPAPPDRLDIEVAPDLDALPRPVIGYSGGLHRHVDYSLVAEMARARPEWSWVLAGPFQTDVGAVDKLPNVRLTGAIPHTRLYRSLAAFDVGLVPYVQSRFTRTVVPVKINEYLAMGMPVVATSLPPVLEFAAVHPGVLLTAEPETGPFLAAIETALALPRTEDVLTRRRKAAAAADWAVLLDRMVSIIEHGS